MLKHFLYKNIKNICVNNKIKNFRIKEGLEILCRKMIIANIAPRLPPKKEKSNNAFSEILLL